jgi:hypothetical protein
MSRMIPLTQGKFALVDDEDFDYLNQWKWCALYKKHINTYYAVRSGIGATHMARLIMSTPKGMVVDHINHNTLDNRRSNLRNVTYSENQTNRRAAKKNPFHEKCISQNHNSYRVQIHKSLKKVYDKTFPTLEQAIEARNAAIKDAHGDFACW